ncbi:unnamed protein product [Trichobilharzia regenti]|nr:unnamed protein product [Trichobilharzia regenti]
MIVISAECENYFQHDVVRGAICVDIRVLFDADDEEENVVRLGIHMDDENDDEYTTVDDPDDDDDGDDDVQKIHMDDENDDEYTTVDDPDDDDGDDDVQKSVYLVSIFSVYDFDTVDENTIGFVFHYVDITMSSGNTLSDV